MMRLLAALHCVTAAAAMSQPGPGPDLTRSAGARAVHLRTVGADGRAAPLHAVERPSDDAEAICRDAVARARLPNDWTLVSRYVTKRSGVTHITLRQSVGGLACSNCVLVCNVDARGRVLNLAYTSHIGPAPDTRPAITARSAFVATAALWNGTVPAATAAVESGPRREVYAPVKGLSFGNVTVELTVIAVGADRPTAVDEATLAWHVSIETEQPYFHMYEVWVQASPAKGASPAVLQLYDLVNWDEWGGAAGAPRPERKAAAPRPPHHPPHPKKRVGAYEVFGIPHIDPTLGDRVIRDDIDWSASPLGWHDQGNGRTFTTTVGNNVCAQDNPSGSTTRDCIDTFRPDGGAGLDFRFDFDRFADPTTSPTKDAAVTNLFYWHNVVHDIFYLNGFDEAAGNFQENNMGLGGLENDAVQANAQDGAGYNNANFATPVDGQRPRCRMYLWNAHTPMKDGDFDSGIIIHEIGHGVSNRLTAGPMTSGCLSNGQAGGMGEGWSDWWAIMLLQEERYVPEDAFPMGHYVAAGGIRNYPYSYDMEVNPATYGYISRAGYTGVHAIGSVWAGILHDVYWVMRREFGFSPNWYNGTAGNNILWQNVLDGLKLQPCNPTFVDARDAILLADEVNYGGRHACTMWCPFARRGLGASASSTGHTDRNPQEGFDTPARCRCGGK